MYKRLYCSVYIRQQEVLGGQNNHRIKEICKELLVVWSDAKSRSVIPVFDPE